MSTKRSQDWPEHGYYESLLMRKRCIRILLDFGEDEILGEKTSRFKGAWQMVCDGGELNGKFS